MKATAKRERTFKVLGVLQRMVCAPLQDVAGGAIGAGLLHTSFEQGESHLFTRPG